MRTYAILRLSPLPPDSLMLQFPYGISHFPTLRNEGFVYLDRTPSIPVLEQAGKQLL